MKDLFGNEFAEFKSGRKRYGEGGKIIPAESADAGMVDDTKSAIEPANRGAATELRIAGIREALTNRTKRVRPSCVSNFIQTPIGGRV